MLRKIKINWVRWIDWVWLSEIEKVNLLKGYNFHELDMEACLEDNQTARIDTYDDYLFVILHFPEYNTKTDSFMLNEFNIFIWKDFIITLEYFWGPHIDEIFERYKTAKAEKDKEIKLSSAFILYEIIQIMLEKMFRVSGNVKKEINFIENKVFENANSNLVKEIMSKKRSIFVFKHMFNPQVVVLKWLEFHIKTLFMWQIEVYFEDLEDKLNNIINNIKILEEYIDSIEDAFKTIIDIKTNFVIKVLALFSALLLPLTLITSFYGMNVDLPYSNNLFFIFLLLWLSIFLMILIYCIFKRNWKF